MGGVLRWFRKCSRQAKMATGAGLLVVLTVACGRNEGPTASPAAVSPGSAPVETGVPPPVVGSASPSGSRSGPPPSGLAATATPSASATP